MVDGRGRVQRSDRQARSAARQRLADRDNVMPFHLKAVPAKARPISAGVAPALIGRGTDPSLNGLEEAIKPRSSQRQPADFLPRPERLLPRA